MWTYHAYRWPSEAAWLAAIAAEGWATGTPPGVELLVSGTVRAPAPDDDTSGEPLPGWHVAAAFRDRAPPAAWAAQEIEPPAEMPVIGRPAQPTLADYQAAVEAHVEATARERSYSGAVSCASYVNDPHPPWAAEAAAFVAWRSAVWLAVYARLAEVQGGAPAPTVAGLVADLPAMVWPA